MSLNIKEVESSEVKEYIGDMLRTFSTKIESLPNNLYHHNSTYQNAPLIISYGILTISDIMKKGIRTYTEDQLRRLADTSSHVNDIDAVSLSLMGLTDLYPNEEEYDPQSKWCVDFLVSREVNGSRCSFNYGNEFLSFGSINPNMLISLDIRLLELIRRDKNAVLSDTDNDLIIKYNSLCDAASTILTQDRNLPIREMSSQNETGLNVERLASTPRLVLKK